MLCFCDENLITESIEDIPGYLKDSELIVDDEDGFTFFGGLLT